MRTLVSITGALSVSVLAGLYIYFVLGLNVSDCTYFIYAVSLPFWCVGFVKPCGMPFEQFAPLWLKANFTTTASSTSRPCVLRDFSLSRKTASRKELSMENTTESRETFAASILLPKAGRVIS